MEAACDLFKDLSNADEKLRILLIIEPLEEVYEAKYSCNHKLYLLNNQLNKACIIQIIAPLIVTPRNSLL